MNLNASKTLTSLYRRTTKTSNKTKTRQKKNITINIINTRLNGSKLAIKLVWIVKIDNNVMFKTVNFVKIHNFFTAYLCPSIDLLEIFINTLKNCPF